MGENISNQIEESTPPTEEFREFVRDVVRQSALPEPLDLNELAISLLWAKHQTDPDKYSNFRQLLWDVRLENGRKYTITDPNTLAELDPMVREAINSLRSLSEKLGRY